MTSKKISLTGDDLTSALDALYENWVPEEVRDRHDANTRRESKQAILDAVWPGFAALIDLANKRLKAKGEDHDRHVSEFTEEQPFKRLMLDIAEVNRANGWVTNDRSFGDDIALIHSEASEAYEEYRAGHQPDERYYSTPAGSPHGTADFPGAKPEGVPSELADILVRVLDTCYRYGIDIDAVLAEKLEHNRTRGHRHGGKVV